VLREGDDGVDAVARDPVTSGVEDRRVSDIVVKLGNVPVAGSDRGSFGVPVNYAGGAVKQE
jgi:hypothetical protein